MMLTLITRRRVAVEHRPGDVRHEYCRCGQRWPCPAMIWLARGGRMRIARKGS